MRVKVKSKALRHSKEVKLVGKTNPEGGSAQGGTTLVHSSKRLQRGNRADKRKTTATARTVPRNTVPTTKGRHAYGRGSGLLGEIATLLLAVAILIYACVYFIIGIITGV